MTCLTPLHSLAVLAKLSGCVRTIEKILPASETNHIAGFVEFRPLTS